MLIAVGMVYQNHAQVPKLQDQIFCAYTMLAQSKTQLAGQCLRVGDPPIQTVSVFSRS
jgi:hypothetical protein